MEEKNMVRLLVADSEVEANFLKGTLEDNDIHVFVKGMGDSAFGVAVDGPDQIEVFVYEDDLDKSKEILLEVIQDEGDEIPAWTCKCGEDVDEGFGICWSCGADYVGPVNTGDDSESV